MKNSITLGFAIGLVFPLLAFLLTRYSQVQAVYFSDKPAGIYVIAAAINLVGCWISYKMQLDKFGNGLVLATFIGMIGLVFSKSISIF